jgi:hypothetical protein
LDDELIKTWFLSLWRNPVGVYNIVIVIHGFFLDWNKSIEENKQAAVIKVILDFSILHPLLQEEIEVVAALVDISGGDDEPMDR